MLPQVADLILRKTELRQNLVGLLAELRRPRRHLARRARQREGGLGLGATADYLERAPLLNLGAEIADFADTMAAVESLDLVITVDTAMAPSGGRDGQARWDSAPLCTRLALERGDSPWYPTARLFRQPSPGDWNGVAREVAKALFEPEEHQPFLGTANGLCAGACYPSFAEPNLAARV